MTVSRNPWLSLVESSLALGWASQGVMALRVAKAALGGPAACEEVHLMVMEKAKAAMDAHTLLATSLLAGEAHLAPARTVALYRRRVEANQRLRLVQGPAGNSPGEPAGLKDLRNIR